VSVVIACIGAIRVLGAYQASWMSWLNVLLGAWFINSPLVFGHERGGMTAHAILVGTTVVLLACWSVASSRLPAGPPEDIDACWTDVLERG
jgi:hypothetical protein